MKALALFIAFLIGMISGFSLAAWALQDPISVKPAKYTFQRSEGAVPAYALDGTQKLFHIECISESEKDCPQATTDPEMHSLSIPEPSSLGLWVIGLVAMWVGLRPHKR